MASKKTIAVVDNNSAIRNLLQEFLEDEDYQVVTGENGLDAISLAKTSDLSLLFMDLQMPTLNGLDALKEIHQIKPNLKVIMMSGYDEDKLVKNSFELGATDCITKPFDLLEIMQKLNRIL